MADSAKRKRQAAGASNPSATRKKKKGGNYGKWQTPHQKIRAEQARQAPRGTLEPGDSGIWATCARGMEARAATELQVLFDQYVDKLYGPVPVAGDPGGPGEDDGSGSQDIESSIEKELGSLSSAKPASARPFTTIRVDMESILFIKTHAPIEPVGFVQRICQDAGAHGSEQTAKTRYVNRLTPITLAGKANEKSVDETARTVLGRCFVLKSGGPLSEDDTPAHTYAIRPSIRHHSSLDRDGLIKQIAALVHDRHKVNLGNPDKVILVDVFKTACGLGVVDGHDWDALKKFNLTELNNRAADEVEVEPAG